MKPLRPLILPVIYIGIGVGFGAYFSGSSLLAPINSVSKQIRLGEGHFTNPLLECDVAEGTIDAEKINFKGDLEKFINNLEKKMNVNEIALYFRDLNNGPTFGIQQEDPFVPASLLKVPVMMAYFKAADRDPSILDKKLLFTASEAPQAEQTILPAQKLTVGQEYTIEELIERMIIYSDNEALLLLFRALPLDDHKHLYTLLGVDSSVVTDPRASLSVKQYASFFRILFNSSFLSQPRSERALELLSKIDFKDGLRNGVPDTILISHKFGERQIALGERHMHDCGIIYYPQHPYLLCIMTRGPQTPILQRAIEEVSSFVYKKVDEQYRK